MRGSRRSRTSKGICSWRLARGRERSRFQRPACAGPPSTRLTLFCRASPISYRVQGRRPPMETVRGKYLRVGRLQSGMAIRVLPRLESSSLWRQLHASGRCALAPDEHLVVSSLFRKTRGTRGMVTDYFVDGSIPLVHCRRRYFDSKLDSDVAALTLCVVGKRGRRNSHVPNYGELGSIPLGAFSRGDWVKLFADLGEWCPIVPV